MTNLDDVTRIASVPLVCFGADAEDEDALCRNMTGTAMTIATATMTTTTPTTSAIATPPLRRFARGGGVQPGGRGQLGGGLKRIGVLPEMTASRNYDG
ncbi:MAG TPA: hypothetical protein VFB19_06795 [Mycobacterium sp.]|nr:hypothetical protein [Mycobacterium sp.]